MDFAEYRESVQRGKDAVDVCTRFIIWARVHMPNMDEETISIAGLLIASESAVLAGVDVETFLRGAAQSYTQAMRRNRESGPPDDSA
jgi:hypothetical protein